MSSWQDISISDSFSFSLSLTLKPQKNHALTTRKPDLTCFILDGSKKVKLKLDYSGIGANIYFATNSVGRNELEDIGWAQWLNDAHTIMYI